MGDQLVQIIKNNQFDKLEQYLSKPHDNNMLTRATYSSQSLGRHQFVQPIIPDQNLTLLHIAAIYDSLECYILLLKQEGFNIRSLSADSYYPLHYACFHASYEVVMYTLHLDPSIALDETETNHQYLFLSVIGGDPVILSQFFKLGVNQNSVKNKRDDIFSKCISCRSIDCLKILLEHEHQKYDQYGDTTMQMKAIINNQPEALRLLIRSIEDIVFINMQGESVFSLACFYGIGFKNIILDMLRMLHNSVCIEPPSELRVKGVCHWICTLNDIDVARAMLRTPGVNLNRLDDKGRPGIFHLIDKDKSEADTKNIIQLIDLLIENGFNINIRAPPENDIFKIESVLERFTTCIKPNIEIINFLISRGANIYALKKNKNQRLVDGIMQTRNNKVKELFKRKQLEDQGQ